MKGIKLPSAVAESRTAVEKTLLQRRSVRKFDSYALTLQEIGQLCWARQGVTTQDGFRTAPSAGALYPLELYVVCREVEGLEPGIYHYEAGRHALEPVKAGQFSSQLASAALDQPWIRSAPTAIVIAGVYARTTRKYRDRGIRYVHIEAGAAGENICLQAVSLGLGTVVVGAFEDHQLKSLAGLRPEEEPLLIIAVGRPAAGRER